MGGTPADRLDVGGIVTGINASDGYSLPIQLFEDIMKLSVFDEFLQISMACQHTCNFSSSIAWPDAYIWFEDGEDEHGRFANLVRPPRIGGDQKALVKAVKSFFDSLVDQSVLQNLKLAMANIESATSRGVLVQEERIGDRDSVDDILEVYTRPLGWTTQPFSEWVRESPAGSSPAPERIMWLNSVDLTWQCHTPAAQYETMVISLVPSKHIQSIRSISRTTLYCQGEKGPRRMVHSNDVFTWKRAVVFNYPPDVNEEES